VSDSRLRKVEPVFAGGTGRGVFESIVDLASPLEKLACGRFS